MLSFLQEKEFLSKRHLDELPRSAQLTDGPALLRELVRRQWLTSFQANCITQGNAHQLIVGPYRLLEPVGEGGMGKVFKARQVRMDRIVALKIIPPEYVANPNALSRFYREVRAIAQLAHPNIVTAYEANQDGDTFYLAMEFVDGIDLARLVKQSGPLPIPQACEFIRQAALGLQHAHEKGLVHRDIKPGNLMVSRSGVDGRPVVKILDFGLARFEDQAAHGTRLTKLGHVLGTVDYISPEQAGDASGVDIRADIYSLGCSLYYLLTGKAAFDGADSVERTMARLVNDAPSVRGLRPDVPVALEGVVARMLARKAEDRYRTPAEVAGALEPFTRPPSAAEQVRPSPTPVALERVWESLEEPTVPVRIARRRRYGLLAVCSLLLISAGLGVGAWTLWKTRRTSNSDLAVDKRGPDGKKPLQVEKKWESVDLLKLIDPAKDGVQGLWTFQGGTLVSPTSRPDLAWPQKCQVPYIPPEEYDLNLIVERTTDNAHCFVLGLIWAGRQITCMFDAGNDPTSGFTADNKSLDPKPSKNRNLVRTGQILFRGKRTEIGVTVRKSGVTVALDGKRLVFASFDEDHARLSVDDAWRISNGSVLYLATHTPALFHTSKMELKPISGPGKALPESRAEWIDLLSRVDLHRDWNKGNWRFALTTLISDPSQQALLQLPYVPGADYMLKARVERKQGNDAFFLGLVAGKRQVLVFIDGWTSKFSGLQLVDGKDVIENPTKHPGQLLGRNKAAEIVCTVQGDKITAAVDGRKFLDWQGDSARFSLGFGRSVPDKTALFIGSHETGFEISRLEVQSTK